MRETIRISERLMIGAIALSCFGFMNGQTVLEGINNIDSNKFAQAKKVFESLVQKEPTDENYFYLGNTYLVQSEPDFSTADEYFKKGLETNKNAKRTLYSRIGEASIKLGKGNSAGAIADFAAIVKDAKKNDANVRYLIGQALTIYPKENNPQLAIQYLKEAIDLSGNGPAVPAYYYYTLGDADRLAKAWGDAMNAYDRALEVASNKAAVYTRIGTLWTSARKFDLASENIDKAIKADPSYAPAYLALGDLNIIYQNYEQAAEVYKKYLQLADSDPNTVLNYAKLAFIAKDFDNAGRSLDQVWDQIKDPIKYRIKAYIQLHDKNFDEAQQSLQTFLTQVEKSRILPSDSGLEGLILAGIATEKNDDDMMDKARSLIKVAKDAEDETFDWDKEFALVSGVAPNLPSAESGPTTPEIEALRVQTIQEPENTDLLFQLAQKYQEVENWGGAADSWQKMANLLPTWEPAYYYLGFACQKGGDASSAIRAYKQYVDVLGSKTPEEQAQNKETLSIVYYNMAMLTATIDNDYPKALQYVNKSLEANENDTDAQSLKRQLEAGIAANGGN